MGTIALWPGYGGGGVRVRRGVADRLRDDRSCNLDWQELERAILVLASAWAMNTLPSGFEEDAEP